MQAITHCAPCAVAASRKARSCRSGAFITCVTIPSGGQRSLQQRQRRLRISAAAAELPELDAEDSVQPSTLEASTSYLPNTGEDESKQLAIAMAKVAWETKGEDVMVLHVAPLVSWTSYIVIASVFSRPQLNAMLVKMEQEAQASFGRNLSPTQTPGRSQWELLDFGDVCVNVLTEQQRGYYDLESFYGAAEEVELPFVTSGGGPSADDWRTKL